MIVRSHDGIIVCLHDNMILHNDGGWVDAAIAASLGEPSDAAAAAHAEWRHMHRRSCTEASGFDTGVICASKPGSAALMTGAAPPEPVS